MPNEQAQDGSHHLFEGNMSMHLNKKQAWHQKKWKGNTVQQKKCQISSQQQSERCTPRAEINILSKVDRPFIAHSSRTLWSWYKLPNLQQNINKLFNKNQLRRTNSASMLVVHWLHRPLPLKQLSWWILHKVFKYHSQKLQLIWGRETPTYIRKEHLTDM